MKWFFVKKNFRDGWDNIPWIITFNIVILAFAAAAYFSVVGIFSINALPETAAVILSFVIIFAGLFFVLSLLLSISDTAAQIADFQSAAYKDVFTNLKNTFKDSFLLTLVLTATGLLAGIGIPFYLKMQNMVGFLLAAILFWAAVSIVLALQWFMPLRSQMNGDFKKTLKKSFIIFFDNIGFSIFLFIYTVLLTALSILLAFIMPGITGIILAQNNALRLRLYKYDWMEEHPELSEKEARKSIPWKELIAEDVETLGPQTLKGLIFPWKQD